MKSKWLIVVGAVLAVVVGAERYGRPVMAQVRAVLVQNVDEPGRNPFAFFTYTDTPPSSQPATATFAVPAGKRYVVQQFSEFCSVNAPFVVGLQGITNGNYVSVYAPATSAGIGFAGTGMTILYADPGSSLLVSTFTGGTVGNCAVSVSGYVINNP